METPLAFSTVPEACAWLERQTDRPWAESELFDAAIRYGVEMTAAPPLSAHAGLWEFVTPIDFERHPTGFRKLHCLGWRMARLFPIHIGQVWTRGETETVHAVRGALAGNEHVWFDEPVHVTRDQVRIGREQLQKLITKRRGDGRPARAAKDGGCNQASAGVPTKEIIEHFGLADTWNERLRKKDRSRDYDRARRQPGSRAPGKGQTWNPAVFGALLVSYEVAGYIPDRVEIIIQKHFPDWLDEWEAERQDLG